MMTNDEIALELTKLALEQTLKYIPIDGEEDSKLDLLKHAKHSADTYNQILKQITKEKGLPDSTLSAS